MDAIGSGAQVGSNHQNWLQKYARSIELSILQAKHAWHAQAKSKAMQIIRTRKCNHQKIHNPGASLSWIIEKGSKIKVFEDLIFCLQHEKNDFPKMKEHRNLARLPSKSASEAFKRTISGDFEISRVPTSQLKTSHLAIRKGSKIKVFKHLIFSISTSKSCFS